MSGVGLIGGAHVTAAQAPADSLREYELGGVAQQGRVRLDGHLMLMHVRGIDGEGETTRLSEKPEAIGRLAATYNSGLDPSLVLNLRAGYRLFVRDVAAEFFVRVDNLTDAVVLPQLGLPTPGRELQAGIKLAL